MKAQEMKSSDNSNVPYVIIRHSEKGIYNYILVECMKMEENISVPSAMRALMERIN